MASTPNNQPLPQWPAIQVIDNLRVGGAQRLLEINAEHLAGRHQMNVINLDAEGSYFADRIVATGAHVLRPNVTRLSDLAGWVRLWRTLRSCPEPVVHVHLSSATILTVPLARLQGKKAVVTLHNVAKRPAKARDRVKTSIEGFILRHLTAHVIHVGKQVEASYADRLKGVPQTILPNVIAAPSRPSDAQRQRLRDALGCDHDAIICIATGRINRQKDPLTLLAAFAAIAPRCPKMVLCYAGEGTLRPQLEEAAITAGVADRVRFLGLRDDVTDLLGAADIFALSSIFEGLPLGLLEAMALGLPVVATRVGDVPKVTAAGGALLTEPGDVPEFSNALERLYNDENLRMSLSEQAKNAVKGYTDVAGWVDQMQAIYCSVLET